MKLVVFRVTTGIAAIYHLILGCALWLLPAGALTGVTRVMLGAAVEIDDKTLMVARFSSAYLLAFAIVLGLLCWQPVRFRALTIPVLALFGVRLVNKLVFLTTIESTFEITRGRSMFAVATLALLIGLMAGTLPRRGDPRSS